jgi:putative ABC transport system permease protein
VIAELRWTLAALLGHWRRKPFLFAALIAGLALATALWSGVQGLNAQARDSYARAARVVGGAGTLSLAPPGGGTVPDAIFATLRRAGWPVSPILEGRIRVNGSTVRLMGLDPVSAPPGGLAAALGTEAVAAGALFGPEAVTLAAPATLAELGLKDGDRPEPAPGVALPPLSAREGVPPGALVTDIGPAQAALGLEGRVTRLVAPRDLDRTQAELDALAPGLRLTREGPESDLSRLTDSFHLNLTAFGFLSFVVGLFITHGAVGLAVEQRLSTVRTLRACGVSRRALGLALVAELAGFALIAGALGLAAGQGIAAALLPDVAATLRGLYGAPVDASLALPWSWWLAGLAMSLIGALAAAGGAALRLWTLPALAAGRPAALMEATGARLRWQLRAGVALLALAALIARSGEGLVAGFALLGALLLGAALLLPPALGAVARLGAARARAPVARWLWADGRMALNGLSLALMALMLALAANIGVGAMVGSFRAAFDGWLDQRLASELYVRAPDDAGAAALEALAASHPDIRALLPSRESQTRLRGLPVQVQGLADHPTYRDNWPLIAAAPGLWETLAAGEGALVSEQLALRLRLKPGSRLALPTPAGEWPLRVAGVHPDYGNPLGQVVVNLDAFAARFPDAPRGAYGVRIAPGRTQDVMAAISATPALDRAEMIDQGAVKRFSLEVFDRTFAVTHALNALTFGVAGVALFTSLATLGTMRLPQLAPLWAMGLTLRRLAALELARTLGLALLTALIAIPLGVALAWALVAVVNVQAFGWRLPLALFPAEWLRLVALAVVAAGLAALWPALTLARTSPSRLAQALADER